MQKYGKTDILLLFAKSIMNNYRQRFLRYEHQMLQVLPLAHQIKKQLKLFVYSYIGLYAAKLRKCP